jgi:hypothetical protein
VHLARYAAHVTIVGPYTPGLVSRPLRQIDGSHAGGKVLSESTNPARGATRRRNRTADLAPRRSVLTIRQAAGARFGQYALVER